MIPEDTVSKISIAPADKVRPLTVPLLTTISPPESTVVPEATPPASTNSSPPSATIVPRALPYTFWTPPPEIVVEIDAPP